MDQHLETLQSSKEQALPFVDLDRGQKAGATEPTFNLGIFFAELRELGVAAVNSVGNKEAYAEALRSGLRATYLEPVSWERLTTSERQALSIDAWSVVWCGERGISDSLLQITPGGSIFVVSEHAAVSTSPTLRVYSQVEAPIGYRLLVKPRRVDVVIPVYNAPRETRCCIESVKASHVSDDMLDVRYVVVDDASPDASIAELLKQIVPSDWVYIRNEKNLGFVKTCNLAFQMDPLADVVLLNSDTEVSRGWLSRLAKTAGFSADIATVTPVSNEASIYSWPENRQVPTSVGFAEIQRALSFHGADLVPVEIPVGVGFCIYTRRAAINATNGFDEVFGIGYGEETDFCLKAKKMGFRHLLEPRIFVIHRGGASMAGVLGDGRQGNTRPENEQIIKDRYPSFQNEVHRYNQFKRSHVTHLLNTAFAEYQTARNQHVLMVTHKPLFQGSLGGVELHSEETIGHLKSRFTFSSLAPWEDAWQATIDCGNGGTKIETFMLGTDEGAKILLGTIAPDVIHIQHPFGVPQGFVEAANALGIPMIMTLHDHALICPRYNLVGRKGFYCELPSLDDPEHRECLDQAGMLQVDLKEWRNESQRLLSSVKATIFVSEDLKRRTESVFKLNNPAVIECGVGAQSHARPSRPIRIEKTLRVCFLGAGRVDKGTELVSKLVPRLKADGIDIHFLGSSAVHWPAIETEGVHFHGTYGSHEVVKKLHDISPDVVCLFSPWPETFSRTLSEAWLAGVPAVVSPFGAPAERVKKSQAGWVLEEYTAEAAFALLQKIRQSPIDLELARSFLTQTNAPSSAAIADTLSGMYAKFPNRGQRSRLKGAVRMPVGIPFAVPYFNKKPTTRLGRMARFVAKVAIRLEEVGFWKTLERPAKKSIRFVTKRLPRPLRAG